MGGADVQPPGVRVGAVAEKEEREGEPKAGSDEERKRGEAGAQGEKPGAEGKDAGAEGKDAGTEGKNAERGESGEGAASGAAKEDEASLADTQPSKPVRLTASFARKRQAAADEEQAADEQAAAGEGAKAGAAGEDAGAAGEDAGAAGEDAGDETPADEAETKHLKPDIWPFVPAPPPLGETPPTPTPTLDTSGMPLPQRVPERDVDATQVSGAAYSGAGAGNAGAGNAGAGNAETSGTGGKKAGEKGEKRG